MHTLSGRCRSCSYPLRAPGFAGCPDSDDEVPQALERRHHQRGGGTADSGLAGEAGGAGERGLAGEGGSGGEIGSGGDGGNSELPDAIERSVGLVSAAPDLPPQFGSAWRRSPPTQRGCLPGSP